MAASGAVVPDWAGAVDDDGEDGRGHARGDRDGPAEETSSLVEGLAGLGEGGLRNAMGLGPEVELNLFGEDN